ncbi:serine threonine kinase [Fusarium sp. NRRL 52700]|nr:serine threonine kinase [Fusarium sp. NRRL 52700]
MLKDQLENALLPNGINQQEQFLPAGSLQSICNETAVLTELSGYFDSEQAKQYTRYVCDQNKPARQIFSILALINQIELIPSFQDAGFFDQDLPLTKNTEGLGLRSRCPQDQRSILLATSPQNLETIRDFSLKQWCIHVPSFETGIGGNCEDLVLDSSTILPWESAGQNNISGGYGYVQRVRIHKDHNSFETKYKDFALKTILPAKEHTRGIFKQELVAFRKVRPGPNLLELISAFQISGKGQFMLLFPWAEGGSMDDMMGRPSEDVFRSRQKSPKDFVQWTISQCRGLVEALGAVHQVNIVRRMDEGTSGGQARSFGIHLDIKPANILYFSQENARHPLGVLKIADFGLTKCSQQYRSPEHDIGYIISRKVDIWALGCIFFELFTWMLLGLKARQEFRQARMQDTLFSGDWDHIGNGFENDTEDNFFQRHIEIIGWNKGTKATSKAERRILESNSSTCPNKINQTQTPRLKPSISQWIAKLGYEIRRKNGPAFLTWLLEFITDDMLHPERGDRAGYERILDYFNKFVDKKLPRNWDIKI